MELMQHLGKVFSMSPEFIPKMVLVCLDRKTSLGEGNGEGYI